MKNPLLSLLDLWSRRWVLRRPKPVVATKPVVVVTGASEGIGLALSHRFAAAGHAMVMVARHEAVLQAAADGVRQAHGGDPLPLVVDVNATDAPEQIERALTDRGMHVDILVNNAGFGLSGVFHELPQTDIDALIACNISALTRLSHHFLPQMLDRASGGLINVGSLAGLCPGPFQAAYYASKSYVISLTRGIAFETRGHGVRVTVVIPGPVETRFHARMNADTSYYRALVPSTTPELVAAATYRGFVWHQRMIVPGIGAKIVSALQRLVPNFLVVPAMAWLLFPRQGETDGNVRGKTG